MTALLRYNSHAINLILWLCTVQQPLVYSPSCTIITISNLEHLLPSAKESLLLSRFSLTPCPQVIYLLSLHIHFGQHLFLFF